MLAHLRQNSANVKVNIGWVQNLEAVVHSLVAVVEIVVLDFQSLLQVVEGRSQFLGSPENAGEVVIGHGSVLVPLFGQGLSFPQQFQGDVEIF